MFIKYKQYSETTVDIHRNGIRKMASTASGALGARLLSESPPLEFTRAGELNFSRVGFAWPIEHWTAFSVRGTHVFLVFAVIHHVTSTSVVKKELHTLHVFVNKENNTSRSTKVVDGQYISFCFFSSVGSYADENKRLRAE